MNIYKTRYTCKCIHVITLFKNTMSLEEIKVSLDMVVIRNLQNYGRVCS